MKKEMKMATNSTKDEPTSTPSRSAQLFERAKKVMPGGVSRNTVLWSSVPPYVAYGNGCRVTDIDGVTRMMTTAIALETSKGDLPLALGLGMILITLVLLINAAAYMVKEAAQRRYG
jgi:hypothetical protein